MNVYLFNSLGKKIFVHPNDSGMYDLFDCQGVSLCSNVRSLKTAITYINITHTDSGALA